MKVSDVKEGDGDDRSYSNRRRRGEEADDVAEETGISYPPALFFKGYFIEDDGGEERLKVVNEFGPPQNIVYPDHDKRRLQTKENVPPLIR